MIPHTGKLNEILDELVEDVLHPQKNLSFVQHLNTALWQYQQAKSLKCSLPPGWIMQIMDFAKNRTCKYEGEIKGAFYAPHQFTMHPIVSYFPTKAGIVRHAVIVLSDDINHDAHAVDAYVRKADAHVRRLLWSVQKRCSHGRPESERVQGEQELLWK